MGSVTIQSNSYEGRVYTFTVSQSGTSTTVNWTLTSSGGSVSYYACSAVECKINGTSVWSCGQQAWSTKTFPVATGSVSGSLNLGSYGTFSCSLSGNPYYYTPSVKTGNVTLQAGTTTITFANGGGTSYVQINGVNHALPYSVSGSQGSKVYETAIPATGYHFDHTWNSDSGTYYNNPDDWTFISTNRTIYLYSAINTYAINYNANGGSGSTAAQTKTYGTNLTLRANGFTAPTGKHFVRWNTAANGSGTSYNASATYTANAAATLYAQWAYNTYTISFNANGGSGAPGNQTKTYGTNLTLSSTKPTRTGYTFKGWATSSTGGVSYAAGGTYSSNSAATLYAVWEANTYTLSYDGNGGTPSKASQIAKYAAKWGTLATCSRSGYTFKGWFTAKSGGTQVTADTVCSGNLTVYARWEANTYTVTLNQNGATTSGTTSQSVTFGSTPSAITKPSRQHNIDIATHAGPVRETVVLPFTGFNNSANTIQYIDSSGTWTRAYDIASDTTLYAQWMGVSYTLPSPTRVGYTFLGYKKSDGTIYQAGASVAVTSDMSFTEMWRADSVLVKDNGEWVEGLVWVRENGQWVRGKLFTKKNDEWVTK